MIGVRLFPITRLVPACPTLICHVVALRVLLWARSAHEVVVGVDGLRQEVDNGVPLVLACG
jgi:hypothetical protein